MANDKDLSDGVNQEDEDFYETQDVSGHEDDLSEDSGDENWEEDESPSPSKKEKKKSSLSTIAIIAGGVVVGLVVLYLQFGGSGSQTPPPEGVGGEPVAAIDPIGVGEAPPQPLSPQQVDAQGGAPESLGQGSPGSLEALRGADGATGIETVDSDIKAESMEKDPSKQAPQGGFMNDPSLLPAEVHGEAQPAVEQPTVEPTTIAPSRRAPAVAEVENPVKPVSDFPTVDAIKKPEMGGGLEQSGKSVEEPLGREPSVAATPAIAPMQPTAVEVSSEEVKVLKAQLEAALKRIDDLEKRSKRPVVSPSSAPSEDVNALRVALDNLQSKVEGLSAKKASLLEKKESETVSESSRTEETKPTQISSPIKKVEMRGDKAKKTVVWDLKGAMPGQAMIALHGETELKTVRVGDEVAGIGRVTVIENSGRGWIVQGTTGQIRQ